MQYFVSLRRRRAVRAFSKYLASDSVRVLGRYLVFSGARCQNVAFDLKQFLIRNLFRARIFFKRPVFLEIVQDIRYIKPVRVMYAASDVGYRDYFITRSTSTGRLSRQHF